MLLNAGKYFITNQSLNHLICYNYLSNQQLEVIDLRCVISLLLSIADQDSSAIELYHFGTLFLTR